MDVLYIHRERGHSYGGLRQNNKKNRKMLKSFRTLEVVEGLKTEKKAGCFDWTRPIVQSKEGWFFQSEINYQSREK